MKFIVYSKNLPVLCLIAAVIIAVISCKIPTEPATILVFSKTAGFNHPSIRNGNAAIMALGATHGFEVDTTTRADLFTDNNLKKYAAVVFLNTTGDFFNQEQEAALERYMKRGGGFVGVHAATDGEYNWPWYGKLVGAYFESHPETQQATLRVYNKEHAATRHLPDEWVRTDEWYNFKNMNPEVKVLISIDETSYKGGKNGENHPMAWYHDYGGGRVFYTALGHTEESYSEPLFLQHLLGGIRYAIGLDKK